MFFKSIYTSVLKVITLLLMIQTLLISENSIKTIKPTKNINQIEKCKVVEHSTTYSKIKVIFLKSLDYRAQIVLVILTSLTGMFFLRNKLNDSLPE